MGGARVGAARRRRPRPRIAPGHARRLHVRQPADDASAGRDQPEHHVPDRRQPRHAGSGGRDDRAVPRRRRSPVAGAPVGVGGGSGQRTATARRVRPRHELDRPSGGRRDDRRHRRRPAAPGHRRSARRLTGRRNGDRHRRVGGDRRTRRPALRTTARSQRCRATHPLEDRHGSDRQPGRRRQRRARTAAAPVPTQLLSRPPRRATGGDRQRDRTRARGRRRRRAAAGRHGAVPPDERDVLPHRRRGAARLPVDRRRHGNEHAVPGAPRRRPRAQLGRLPQRRRRRGRGAPDRLRAGRADRAARPRPCPLRAQAGATTATHAGRPRRGPGLQP